MYNTISNDKIRFCLNKENLHLALKKNNSYVIDEIRYSILLPYSHLPDDLLPWKLEFPSS